MHFINSGYGTDLGSVLRYSLRGHPTDNRPSCPRIFSYPVKKLVRNLFVKIHFIFQFIIMSKKNQSGQ